MLVRNIMKHKYIYMLLLPVLLYYAIFCYKPMYGVLLAFKDFDVSKGIMGSPWVGLEHFREVFSYKDFWTAFYNTLIISAGKLLFGFPAPILLALLINEVSGSKLKKFYQTVFTFPHFISWVVLAGIITNLLSDSGVMNQLLLSLGLHKVNWLSSPTNFRPLLYASEVWKEMGWNSILYLAAIAGINPELYEAARVDGANRFHMVWKITWPSIRNVAAILLVLAVGNILNGGFDQIFNLYNPGVYNVGDIIDTYLYRFTFEGGSSFEVSTAIGLFKSVINFALLFVANYVVKLFGEEGVV